MSKITNYFNKKKEIKPNTEDDRIEEIKPNTEDDKTNLDKFYSIFKTLSKCNISTAEFNKIITISYNNINLYELIEYSEINKLYECEDNNLDFNSDDNEFYSSYKELINITDLENFIEIIMKNSNITLCNKSTLDKNKYVTTKNKGYKGQSYNKADFNLNKGYIINHLKNLCGREIENIPILKNNHKNFSYEKIILLNIPIIIILYNIIFGEKNFNSKNIDKFDRLIKKLKFKKTYFQKLITYFQKLMSDPYSFVRLHNNILTFKQAEKIELYFNIKINIQNKILAFISSMLYFNNIYEKKYNNKLIRVYINSHYIHFIDLLRLLYLEFEDISFDELNKIFIDNFDEFVTICPKIDKNYIKSCLKLKVVNRDNVIHKGKNIFINKNNIPLGITTKEIHNIEKYIGEKTVELCNTDTKPIIKGANYKKCNFKQKIIFNINKMLTIINGGPGTGKTYTVSKYILDNSDEDTKIYCLAPTHAAKENLLNTFGSTENIKGYTLDKFNFKMFKKKKIHIRNNIIIVIDELSMCSYIHMYGFYKQIEEIEKIHNIIKIIYLGDPNQLPSINIGKFAEDINNNIDISKNIINLTENQRSRNSQGIIENLSNIKNSKSIIKNNETEILNYKDNSHKELIIQKILKNPKYNSKNTKLITPLNKERDICNIICQDIFNKNEIICQGEKFKIKKNDICISLENVMYENNKDIKYYNGSEWIINYYKNNNFELESTIDANIKITVNYPEFVSNFVLGYTLTTHKAQGLSIENIIYIIPENCNMLTNIYSNGKSNIYTGISRAKNMVIIIKPSYFIINKIYNSNFKKETNLF